MVLQQSATVVEGHLRWSLKILCNSVKIKQGFLLLLHGILILIFGAWMKIVHHSYFGFTGTKILTIGLVIQTAALLCIFYKMLRSKNTLPFLRNKEIR